MPDKDRLDGFIFIRVWFVETLFKGLIQRVHHHNVMMTNCHDVADKM